MSKERKQLSRTNEQNLKRAIGRKERENNNTPEDKIANIREENHTEGKILVETIHPISQEDTDDRSKHDDNGQRKKV